MANPVPLPSGEHLIVTRNRQRYPRFQDADPNEGRISQRWSEYFNALSDEVSQAARRLHSAELRDQDASIAATDVTDATLVAGTYRLSYYATIVVAATVSSSLTVALDWTDRAQSKTITFSAITANTTGTVQSQTLLIRISSNSPVRYATTYSSTGDTAMEYDLKVVLERIEA